MRSDEIRFVGRRVDFVLDFLQISASVGSQEGLFTFGLGSATAGEAFYKLYFLTEPVVEVVVELKIQVLRGTSQSRANFHCCTVNRILYRIGFFERYHVRAPLYG